MVSRAGRGAGMQDSDEGEGCGTAFQHIEGQHLGQELLANWEDNILKGKDETQTSPPDDAKTANVMNETHGPLQEHLRLNAMIFKKYAGVKQGIMNCFRRIQISQG